MFLRHDVVAFALKRVEPGLLLGVSFAAAR